MGTKSVKVARALKDKTHKPIEPFTNYYIKELDHEKQGAGLLNSMVKRYVIKINVEDNIHLEKSLFGKYIIFSDKLEPTEKGRVISYIPRERFLTIDIEENTINILCELLHIDNQSLITYAQRYLAKKPKDLILYYLQILKEYVEDGVFNTNKTKELMKTRPLESTYFFKDKYLQTSIAFSYFTLKNVTRMFGMFNIEQMDIYNVIGWLGYINKEQPPEFMKEEYQKSISSDFKKNIIHVLSLSINVQSVEELYYKCLPYTKT